MFSCEYCEIFKKHPRTVASRPKISLIHWCLLYEPFAEKINVGSMYRCFRINFKFSKSLYPEKESVGGWSWSPFLYYENVNILGFLTKKQSLIMKRKKCLKHPFI